MFENIHSSNNKIKFKSNSSTYIHPVVKYGKRIFDISFSITAILLLLPLLPFISLAIKSDSKGPVLYKQLRIGKCKLGFNHVFNIIKFRTMYTNAEIDLNFILLLLE